MAMIGPQRFCGIAKVSTKTSIEIWLQAKWQVWWNQSPGVKQAKEFIKRPTPKFTENLLHQERKLVRAGAGPITVHCRLRKHMSMLNQRKPMVGSARKKGNRTTRTLRVRSISKAATCKVQERETRGYRLKIMSNNGGIPKK